MGGIGFTMDDDDGVGGAEYGVGWCTPDDEGGG